MAWLDYRPQQAPGLIQSHDGVRKFTEEELQRLARFLTDQGVTLQAVMDGLNGTLATCVRTDIVQSFTGPQQAQARSNIGIVAPSQLSGSLSADVALNNTANYFDGPSIAQGSSGTWFASGTVTLVEPTAGAGATFYVKLWDGTNVIASAAHTNSSALYVITVALSGFITSPAGNLRISVRDINATTGKILFNSSGNSKDSTISAFRIA